MNILVLGKGKTGGLVADVAQERGHEVNALSGTENVDAMTLTKDRLAGIDVVIDFTTPDAVVANIQACTRLGKNMVVGTTGWDQHLVSIRKLIEEKHTGFL